MRWMERVRNHAPVYLLLMAVVWIGYGQSLDHELIHYDDGQFITHNPHVTEGLSAEHVAWAFRTTHMSMWHPLTWLSYQVETTLAGAEAHGVRHGVNVILHLLTCWIVYHIGIHFFPGRKWVAVGCAVLFACHPQHVQSVAWISERKGLLAGVFCSLALLLHLKEKRRAALIFFACALMSKPSALPLFVWIPLYDLLESSGDWKGCLKKRRVYYAAGWSLTLPLVWMTVGAQQKQTVVTSWWNEGLGELCSHVLDTAGTCLQTFGYYLRSFVIPWPLPFFVDLPDTVPVWGRVAGVLILMAFGWVVYRYRALSAVRAGLLWFVIFWLPVSGLIPFHEYEVADRYMYLPHIGLLIAVSGLAIHAYERLSDFKLKRLCLCGVLTLCCVCLFLTRTQNSYWQNGLTLFAREVEVSPEPAIAHVYLGRAYAKLGQVERAEGLYREAVQLDETLYYGYTSLGFLYVDQQKTKEAIQAFDMALQHADPRRHHLIERVYEHLVWLYMSEHLYYPAHQVIQEALKRYPNNAYIQEAGARTL